MPEKISRRSFIKGGLAAAGAIVDYIVFKKMFLQNYFLNLYKSVPEIAIIRG